MALSRKLTTTVVLLLQDVRGRFGSEGEFRHMTPHIDEKSGEDDVDESSDTYDTIEWLINNVPNNNGNVGITGNSYGGFYSVAGMISNHPALKCAAPTAPINDMFVGDDFHHNGAFVRSSACAILLGALFSLLLQTLIVIVTLVRPDRHVLVRGILCCAAQYLPHAFNFLGSFGFGKENPNPTRADVALPYGKLDYKTPDGYEFYLNAGEKRLLSFLMKRDHLPRQAQDRQT